MGSVTFEAWICRDKCDHGVLAMHLCLVEPTLECNREDEGNWAIGVAYKDDAWVMTWDTFGGPRDCGLKPGEVAKVTVTVGQPIANHLAREHLSFDVRRRNNTTGE